MARFVLGTLGDGAGVFRRAAAARTRVGQGTVAGRVRYRSVASSQRRGAVVEEPDPRGECWPCLRAPSVAILYVFTFHHSRIQRHHLERRNSRSAARCAECGLPAAVASWGLAPAVGCGISFADRLG